jgi:hypothetical protein
VSDYSDPSFERTGTVLYTPALYNNIFGYNSVIAVRNAHPGTITINVYLRGRVGYRDLNKTYTIYGNGRKEIDLNAVFNPGEAWVGSARITSSYQIAARIFDKTRGCSYNATADPDNNYFMPGVYRTRWGITSGLVIQNTSTVEPINVTLTFYNEDGTFRLTYLVNNGNPIEPERAVGVFLSNILELPSIWSGTLKISGGTKDLAVAVHVIFDATGIKYESNAASEDFLIRPARYVFLPRASKNYAGRTTGARIMNISNSTPVSINAYYFNSDGNLAFDPYPLDPIPPHGARSLGQGNPVEPDSLLPDGWQGSIALVASGPIAVIIREDGNSATSAYNGVAIDYAIKHPGNPHFYAEVYKDVTNYGVTAIIETVDPEIREYIFSYTTIVALTSDGSNWVETGWSRSAAQDCIPKFLWAIGAKGGAAHYIDSPVPTIGAKISTGSKEYHQAFGN